MNDNHLTLYFYFAFVFVRNLAAHLNDAIFAHITSKHYYSIGGGQQLQHDMKALWLLFRSYTNKPENFFKE